MEEALDVYLSTKFSVGAPLLRHIAVTVCFLELQQPLKHLFPDVWFNQASHEANLIKALLSLSHDGPVVPLGMTLIVDPSGKLRVRR